MREIQTTQPLVHVGPQTATSAKSKGAVTPPARRLAGTLKAERRERRRGAVEKLTEGGKGGRRACAEGRRSATEGGPEPPPQGASNKRTKKGMKRHL